MPPDVPPPARPGRGLQGAQVLLDPVEGQPGGAADATRVPHVPSARRPTPYPRARRSDTAPPLPRLELDARTVALPWQRAVLAAMGAALVAVIVAAALGHPGGLVLLLATVTAFYCADLAFYAYLVGAGRRDQGRQRVRTVADPRPWPVFTVLCPMYRETAVLPQFVKAIAALDYPVARLQVLLLLEEDDVDTIAFARAMALPPSFEIVVVPDGLPKTKPRACNHGLRIARGEYVVIFDAEDVPEPDQLRIAAAAFRAAGPEVICFQARLNYHNSDENLLTRFFTLEYSHWFDLMLEGLAALRLPIPLGGTSNHFRTDALRRLGAWDPHNVTEDADLGLRAAAHGLAVGTLPSTTWEEACCQVRPWIKQRTRWIKGYMQTTLVHTRHPIRFVRAAGARATLTLVLLIAGTPLAFLASPILWVTTTIGLARGDTPLGGSGLTAHIAVLIAISAIAALRRGRPALAAAALLMPLYWTLHSFAAWRALIQLITKPSYWEKTPHGLSKSTVPDPASAHALAAISARALDEAA